MSPDVKDIIQDIFATPEFRWIRREMEQDRQRHAGGFPGHSPALPGSSSSESLATPAAYAKSEAETLRRRCAAPENVVEYADEYRKRTGKHLSFEQAERYCKSRKPLPPPAHYQQERTISTGDRSNFWTVQPNPDETTQRLRGELGQAPMTKEQMQKCVDHVAYRRRMDGAELSFDDARRELGL